MRARSLLAASTVVLVLAGACTSDDEPDAADGTATTTTSRPGTTEAAGPEGWLCHPDLPDDPCTTADLRTTLIDFELTQSVDEAPPATDPVADCFYVPPSGESAHSDEWIRVEAARFRTVCRVFVPDLGTPDEWEARLATAFDRYLDAAGDRPFVLIGHQQGADLLTGFVQDRIANDPDLAGRMLSAILVGNTSVQVTNDGTPGGTFPTFPLCASSDQLGCIITFHAFEDGFNPEAGVMPFIGSAPTNSPACTNPAGIEGGRGQLRAATFPVESTLLPSPAVTGLPAVETPFVTLPEYYLAECLSLVSGTVELWIGRSIDPDDQRRPGPLTETRLSDARSGARQHDFTLTMGDLLHLVEQQSEAFADR